MIGRPHTVLTAVALVAGLAAVPVRAQGRGGGAPRGARIERLLQQRLGLTESQLTRLRTTTRSYGPERVSLARREALIADSIRAGIAAPSRDEARIGALLDRLFAVRRARLDLRAREQRELAGFMTPSQRAMLLGLEEQAQRRAAINRERRGAPR